MLKYESAVLLILIYNKAKNFRKLQVKIRKKRLFKCQSSYEVTTMSAKFISVPWVVEQSS